MKSLKYRVGGIIEIQKLDDGSYMVLEDPVLESDHRFDERKDLSNLYKVAHDFNFLWEAELPNRHSQYTSTVRLSNGQFKAFTGDFFVTLDLNTGKIISKQDAR